MIGVTAAAADDETAYCSVAVVRVEMTGPVPCEQ